MPRPHDSLERAVGAHRALADPAVAAEAAGEAERRAAELEAKREKRRAQTRNKGGRFA
jgi:hypothetical protein